MLANVPAGFTETAVATGLTSPITMDIEESGRIWLALQDGRIEVIENDQHLPNVFQLDADGSGERGLQGIELDPDFETNHYIYVYYTADSPEGHNRLSRLTVDSLTENTIVPDSEVILLELPYFSTFPQNQSPIWHMGGAIHFMANETIAVQVGDHLNNSLVQNLDQPLGKILRVNKDGTPAADNPMYDAGDGIGWRDYIWAAGLRNPFSGDIDPVTGRYFVNDVGEGTWEEINDATVPGLNFGWPTTEGNFNPTAFPNFTNPLLTYNHSDDCAVTGGSFNSYATPPANPFPVEYDGFYFCSQFCAGEIRVFDPDNPEDDQSFITGASFPMNIEFGPDGAMYYIARGAGAGGAPGIETGMVLKVEYVANVGPQIVQHPQDTLVSVGYDASFSVSAAGTPALMFQWQRDSGSGFVDIEGETNATLQVPNVMLADHGAQFRVVITNNFGTATSNAATLNVTTDTPPIPFIDLPPAGLTYSGGDIIDFSGGAVDAEDGPLDAASLTWQIDFHHDEHLHPFFPPTSGITGGTFTIPTISETSANVWYRVRLIATDSIELTGETFRDLFPNTTDFTLDTNVGGGQILLDGQPMNVPLVVTGVENIQRTLEAPASVTHDGVTGLFREWIDGETNRLRTIATPVDETAFVAIYEDVSSSMTFLSDLDPSTEPINGWGPIERDTSNGENSPGDGIPISIDGVNYLRGLGVHALSDVRYDLGGSFERFIADVGLDDETGNAGTVVFHVFADDAEVYTSSMLTGVDPFESLDVDVSGVNELRLVVTDAGDGVTVDHADWANARLIAGQTGDDIRINFQPDGVPIPAGYLPNTGLVFGDRGNGQSYGWSSDHTDLSRDRGVREDQRLDTLVHFHAGQTWEVALPDGTYAVTASIGDVGFPSTYTLNVEGVTYWANENLGENELAIRTKIVGVLDGRLTLDMGNTAEKATRITHLEITPVSSPELIPLASADVNLDGRLTLADARGLAAGWGEHAGETNLQALSNLGDLTFDGVTNEADWALFDDRWNSEHATPLNLAALLNPIAGDYYPDGVVDSLDNDTWRSTFASKRELSADGNGDGIINAADYVVWRNHLGDEIPLASASGLQSAAVMNSPVVTNPLPTIALNTPAEIRAAAMIQSQSTAESIALLAAMRSLLNATIINSNAAPEFARDDAQPLDAGRPSERPAEHDLALSLNIRLLDAIYSDY